VTRVTRVTEVSFAASLVQAVFVGLEYLRTWAPHINSSRRAGARTRGAYVFKPAACGFFVVWGWVTWLHGTKTCTDGYAVATRPPKKKGSLLF
jgi:hypothetical protein